MQKARIQRNGNATLALEKATADSLRAHFAETPAQHICAKGLRTGVTDATHVTRPQNSLNSLRRMSLSLRKYTVSLSNLSTFSCEMETEMPQTAALASYSTLNLAPIHVSRTSHALPP